MLHEFWDGCKESISQDVRNNIRLEDDHASNLLWRSLCTGFHKLKDLQECERKVARLKEELTVDDEEPPVISSHFNSCIYSAFDYHDGTKVLIGRDDKGASESFFSAALESVRFENDGSYFALEQPDSEKYQNIIQLELEAFSFNEGVSKSDFSCLKIYGHPIEESCQFKTEVCDDDKVK